jgi:hypothetical protein
MKQVTILPLHGGKAPKWLFWRMVKLAGSISEVIIDEFGPDDFVCRLSDSNWFQALSCAIGYDWHSSGTTTVTIGALKEALKASEEVQIAGGKGKAGLKTPSDIKEGATRLGIGNQAEKLTEISRMAAKVDSSLIYDNFGIYHHSLIFSKGKNWCVVQQGMQRDASEAVRFQWSRDSVNPDSIAEEPHAGISSTMHITTADLTSKDNRWFRDNAAEIAHESSDIEIVRRYARRHEVNGIDISPRGAELIKKASEIEASRFEDLLMAHGIGRKTMRSLAFIGSLIYDKQISFRDPVAYSYNLGGKDGTPFPIDTNAYDSVIKAMEGIVEEARIEKFEKYKILKRLNSKLSSAKL